MSDLGNFMAGDSLEYTGQLLLHPAGLAALLSAVALVFVLPRRFVLVPVVLLLACIPSAQRIVIFTLDFNFVRIILMSVMLRALLYGEIRSLNLLRADKVLLFYCAIGAVAYGALFLSPNAFVARVGYMMEVALGYFAGRLYVRSWRDVVYPMTALAVVSLPLAWLFLLEQTTGRNLMSVFGGVPEITTIRDGKMRAQGAFTHPIMAGVFWASCVPWFLYLGYRKAIPKVLALAVAAVAFVIVLFTASSTPVMFLLVFVFAMLLFPARRYLRLIQYGVLASIVFLQIVMNAPVWHLLARVNVFGGSTGWHRYHLIDQAIARFFEWALVGTRSTASWGYGLADVTNQYILEGVRGGIVTLGLFVWLHWLIFSRIGTLIARTDADSGELPVWFLGSYLFAHAVTFIAVAYFGQVVGFYFMTLGIVFSLALATGTSVAQTSARQRNRSGLVYLN